MTHVFTTSAIELAELEPTERLLLTTDGTLTNMLEAVNLERIVLCPLTQDIQQVDQHIEFLALGPGEPFLERRVVLKGAETARTYVYAESLIAINRLDAHLRVALLTTNTPIGRLWKRNRVETFKEVLEFGLEAAGELAPYFETRPDTPLLLRKSRVSSGGKPIALITERIFYQRAKQAIGHFACR